MSSSEPLSSNERVTADMLREHAASLEEIDYDGKSAEDVTRWCRAADEIERLTRELVESKRHRDNAIDKFNSEYEATKYLLALNDHLRAALEIAAPLLGKAAATASNRDDLVKYGEAYGTVREALKGSSSETKALRPTVETGAPHDPPDGCLDCLRAEQSKP